MNHPLPTWVDGWPEDARHDLAERAAIKLESIVPCGHPRCACAARVLKFPMPALEKRALDAAEAEIRAAWVLSW